MASTSTGAQRMLAHAEGGAGVPTRVGPEHLLEEIRRPVDGQMAVGEVGIGVHITRHRHHAGDARCRVIVAKGVHAPVAAYDSVCKLLLGVDTPGVTAADVHRFTYRHRRTPLFPIEATEPLR